MFGSTRRTPGGAAQRAWGIAQAVTSHRPISKLELEVESQTHGGGQKETKGSRENSELVCRLLANSLLSNWKVGRTTRR